MFTFSFFPLLVIVVMLPTLPVLPFLSLYTQVHLQMQCCTIVHIMRRHIYTDTNTHEQIRTHVYCDVYARTHTRAHKFKCANCVVSCSNILNTPDSVKLSSVILRCIALHHINLPCLYFNFSFLLNHLIYPTLCYTILHSLCTVQSVRAIHVV